MLRILTNHTNYPLSADNCTVITHFLNRWTNFHKEKKIVNIRNSFIGQEAYFLRKTIRPRERSYGVSSTRTVSPSIRLMKFFRIFPDIYARIIIPPPPKSSGSLTSKIAPGRVFIIVPSTSILSSFCFLESWSLLPIGISQK